MGAAINVSRSGLTAWLALLSLLGSGFSVAAVGSVEAASETLLVNPPDPLGGSVFDPTGWTTGTKKVLFIRVRFPDQPNVDPISQAELAPAWTLAQQQLPSYSDGLFAFDPQLVLTPTVTMPNPSSYYTGRIWFEEFLSDARAAAAGSGAGYNPLYDSSNYNLDVIISKVTDGSTPQPIAVLGGKGMWVSAGAFNIQALAHEFGHNLGLSHASWGVYGYSTFGPLKIDPASLVEYGCTHDVMGNSGGVAGAGGSPKFHFNPIQKHILGWLPASAFHRATTSGTYRIYAHDLSGVPAGQKVGLRVPHSSQEDVWYSFRQLWPDNPWSFNGAEMHLWNPYVHTYGTANTANTIRLDPNPATPQGVEDAALVIGRTFYDAYSKVYVTPIGKGGTTPESLDLVVNVGPFPGDNAPTAVCAASNSNVVIGAPVTFTATASDSDGDTLAYHWDFGDSTFAGTNSAVASKVWNVAGTYRVTCVVSDMKGGEAWHSQTITVGAPSVASISGIVLDALGNPMAGVHINNGLNSLGNAGYRGTFSASDGSFTLSNLAAGSYTLSAGQDQSLFNRDGGWINPIVVAAGDNLLARNFRRAGGLTSITGRVRAGPSGAFIAGVTVRIAKSDGSTTDVVSNSSAVWQLNVPQGITTITALAPAGSGWTSGDFYPAPGGASPAPWVVNVGGTAIDNLNFYFRTPDLPVVGFQSATSSVSEGAGEAIIPVSVTRSFGTRLYMNLKIGGGGTATGGNANGIGVDHYLPGMAFTFPPIDVNNPPGNMIEQTFNVHVPIVDDNLFEGDETLDMYLIIGQITYAVSNQRHTLTIIDNDVEPSLFADGFE